MDIDDIADAIVKVSSDEKLRKRLAAAGLKRAQKFSWEESGRKLSRIIDELTE